MAYYNDANASKAVAEIVGRFANNVTLTVSKLLEGAAGKSFDTTINLNRKLSKHKSIYTHHGYSHVSFYINIHTLLGNGICEVGERSPKQH